MYRGTGAPPLDRRPRRARPRRDRSDVEPIGGSAHMTDDPLRLGIVGVGALTLRAILPHMTQDDIADRVIVSSVCDPAYERAKAAAERFDIPTAVADIDHLLGRDDVDLVTIVSPI